MNDIGKMGEKIFSYWCSTAGLVVNKATEDETGWDFHVEFPFTSNPDFPLPLDMQKSPIECKIQVKATNTQNKSVQITLSVLHRLVKSPLPAFIAFIEFDDTNTAQRAYLVHLDKEIIGRTLKRVRELNVKGEGEKLNKRKLLIRYDESHQLSNTSGDSLKLKILSHIGNDIKQYIDEKIKIVNSIGFETGFATTIFTIEAEYYNDFVQALLGFEQEVNVSSMATIHKRFGISDDRPFVNLQVATMSIQKTEKRQSTAVFQKGKLGERIEFPCDVYSTFYLQEPYQKLRMKSEIFDMIISRSDSDVEFSFSFNEATLFDLVKLRKIARFFNIIGTASQDELVISIKDEGIPESIIGTLKIAKFKNNISQHESIISNAYLIANELEVVDKITTTFGELYQIKDRLLFITPFIKLDTPELKIDFQINLEHEQEKVDEKETALVFFQSFHLGGFWFAFFISVIGMIEQDSTCCSITTNKKSVDFKTALENTSKISQADLIAEVKKIEDKYEKQGLAVIRMFDDSED